MKVIKDKDLYRIQWPDGSVSVDVYNRTRAEEYVKVPEVQNLPLHSIYNGPYWSGDVR